MTTPSRPAQPPLPRLLALDIDGVLTDASIFIDASGREMKRFNSRDGVGLRAWTRLGLPAAAITGRSGPAISHRLADLGVTYVIQGSKDKNVDLDRLIAESGVPASEIAYMGDDWPDLPVLRRVGYPMAVADAHPHVKAAARFVSTTPGGHGAVREAIEHVLGVLGRLDEAVRLYDPAHG